MVWVYFLLSVFLGQIGRCFLLREDDFARFASLCVQSKFTRASCTSLPDVVTPLSTLLPPIPNSIPLRGQVKGTKYPVFTLCCALKSPCARGQTSFSWIQSTAGTPTGRRLEGQNCCGPFLLSVVRAGEEIQVETMHLKNKDFHSWAVEPCPVHGEGYAQEVIHRQLCPSDQEMPW